MTGLALALAVNFGEDETAELEKNAFSQLEEFLDLLAFRPA